MDVLRPKPATVRLLALDSMIYIKGSTWFPGPTPSASAHRLCVGDVAAEQLTKLSIGPVFLAAIARLVRQSVVRAPVADLCDHLASRLVALAAVGLLFQLLDHPVARSAVFQRKLRHDAAKRAGFRFPNDGRRRTEPKKKLAKPT